MIGFVFLVVAGGLMSGCGGGGGGSSSGGGDTTAPTVSFSVPADGATGIPLNTDVVTSFSEAMDVATITDLTFTLVGPGAVAVPGVVTYAGNAATFNPTGSLAGNTLYVATITTGAKDIAGNAFAANHTWSFTTGAMADTTAPTVSSTFPIKSMPIATGAATNANISATFSEGMSPATINNTNFSLAVLWGATVPGVVTYAGTVATFNPASALLDNTTYRATISGVKDLAGNVIVANYTFDFMTGSASDTTAPTVSSTSPVNNATGVAPNGNISVTFSEVMTPLTITGTSFTLKQGVTVVPGVVTYVGLIATLNPTVDLTSGLVYTGTITTGAKDLAGNPMAAYTWSFTAGATADITSPTVSSTIPAKSTPIIIDVGTNANISATFNETMNSATITNTTFTLKQGVSPIAGAVTYSGLVATFNPEVTLTGGLTYTAAISTGAKDLAGNALVAYSWSFTTGVADVTAPTVSSTVPVDTSVGAGTNGNISATFSEGMNATTITSATFILKQGANSIVGTVTYAGLVATFNPTSELPGNLLYVARLTTGAKDLAGLSLVADKVWTFTTGPGTDITPPSVTLRSPLNGAGGVAALSNVTVTFSEAMNPTTITTSTFTLKQGATSILGAVLYADLLATFNPTSALAANTVYTARVAMEAKDLAGNSLTAFDEWTFTTAAGIGPAAVNLGTAGNYAILTESGITDVPISAITGDIGTSPITGAAIGLTCTEVAGTMYSVDAGGPACAVVSPVSLNTAILDMHTAYTNAHDRAPADGPFPSFLNFGAGVISAASVPLTAGLYQWTTGVNVTGNFTFSGGASDIWIMQVSGPLDVANGTIVTLSGGAQAKNIFWIVEGQTTLGTTSQFQGIILDKTAIVMQTGATLNGRALAQTAVTLQSNVVTEPN